MTPKPLALIIENNIEDSNHITRLLNEASINTQTSHHISSALNFLKCNFVNLIILKDNMPDLPGINALSVIKKQSNHTPTIIISASDSINQKIEGLNLGADDYICQPYDSQELVARIKTVLRRTETAFDHNVTHNARLTMHNFSFCGATVQPLNLSINFPNNNQEIIGVKELGLLILFINNPGAILSRRYIIHTVWGEHANIKSRSLDQYIRKIRKIYNANGLDCLEIKTVHGVGFIYEP